MKKKLVALGLTLMMVFGLTGTAFAGEKSYMEKNYAMSLQENVYYVDDYGNRVEAPTTRVIIHTLDSKKLTNQFVGYSNNTPTWTKAYQYVLTAGKTYKANGSWFWKDYGTTINLECSVSKGADTYLAVDDPSKYSKLGIYADITIERQQVVQGGTATIRNKVTYDDKYTRVVYK